MKRLLRALVLLLVPACTGVSGAPRTAVHAQAAKQVGPTPCERAHGFRARVPKLVAEGKLDRTVRVIKKADELCAEDAPKTWAPLVAALSELGREDEAEKLAKTIDAATDAPADAKEAVAKLRSKPKDELHGEVTETVAQTAARAEAAAAKGDHEHARDAYLELWKKTRPNGRALAQAGLHAKALGDAVGGQKLFDRAVAELERETGRGPRAVLPSGSGFIKWSPDSLKFALMGSIGESSCVMIGHEGAAGPELGLVIDSEVTPGAFDFTSDGSMLVSYNGSEITLIDVATGRTSQVEDAGNYVFSRDNKILFYARSSGAGVIAYDVDGGGRLGSAEAPPLVDRPTTLSLLRESGRLYAFGDGLYLYDAQLKPAIKIESSMSWAFSQDEKLLASLSSDPPVISIYEVGSGKLQKAIQLPADRAGMYGVLAFSPDKKTLALSDYEAGMTLFDVKSGRARGLRSSPEYQDPLATIAFTADGKRICGAPQSTMNPACAYNVQTGEYLLGDKPPKKQGDKVIQPFVFLDANVATVVDVPMFADGGITSKDRTLYNQGWGPTAVMSPDKRSFALYETSADAGDMHLVVVDVASKKPTADIALPAGDVAGDSNSIAFGPDSKTLTLTSQSSRVLVDVVKGRVVATAPGPSDGSPTVYRPDGREIAAAGTSGDAMIIDTATGATHAITREHASPAKLALSPDGKILAINEKTRTVALWDLSQGKTLKSLENLEVSQGAAAITFDDKRIAIAQDSAVHLVDIATGAEAVKLADADAYIVALAFSRDGTKLAGALRNGATSVWDVPSGEVKKTLSQDAHRRPLTHIAFDVSGRYLSLTNDLKMSELWDLSQMTIVRTGDRSGPTAFSPDGKTLVIGPELIDFENGTTNVKANVGAQILSVAFTTDGSAVVMAAGDGLHVVNAITGVAEDPGAALNPSLGPPPPPEPDDQDDTGNAPPPPPPPQEQVRPAFTVSQLALRSDGKTLLGYLASGEIGVFGVPDLKHRVTLTPHGPRLAMAASDDGLIELIGDSHAELDASLVCSMGPYLLPFAVCAERLVAPGLYAKAVAGDETYLDP